MLAGRIGKREFIYRQVLRLQGRAQQKNQEEVFHLGSGTYLFDKDSKSRTYQSTWPFSWGEMAFRLE
jgi:hypothetical protein